MRLVEDVAGNSTRPNAGIDANASPYFRGRLVDARGQFPQRVAARGDQPVHKTTHQSGLRARVKLVEFDHFRLPLPTLPHSL